MTQNGHLYVYTGLLHNQMKHFLKNCLKAFKSLDKCSTLYDNHLLFGDLNYDLLSESKSKPLTDIMELFDYKNLIKGATCFKKDCVPTLNDVILTNVSNKCMKSLNFCTGISDCHNFISTVINSNIARDEMTKFEYRSHFPVLKQS